MTMTEREFIARGETMLAEFRKHIIGMSLGQALKFYGGAVESIGEGFIGNTKGLSGLQLSMVLSVLRKVIQNLELRHLVEETR